MSTVVLQDSVRIPDHVVDVDSFCRWACSDEFPERGQFSFLDGEVWVDMSPENAFNHNQVKAEYAFVLIGLAKTTRLGRYWPDRMLLRNYLANLSTEPDGMFISHQSLKSGQARITSVAAGYDVIEGTPDMVLEVLSRSSETKDDVVLRRLYWAAGIPEYWLVDTRGKELRFDILRRAKSGYVATRKHAGWHKSEVFGQSFKLTVATDESGIPEYTLHVR